MATRPDWPVETAASVDNLAATRSTILRCIPLLEQQNRDARDEHDCERADRLLVDVLLLKTKERLCVCIEEWHAGHFGNAWAALARAKIHLEVVVENGGGATAAGWCVLLADCERRFPRMVGGSIEAEVIQAHCSVCGQSVLSCSHIAGRIYCGVLCCRVVTEVGRLATSIVEKAAQPEARIQRIYGVDVEAEGLFWDEGEVERRSRDPNAMGERSRAAQLFEQGKEAGGIA